MFDIEYGSIFSKIISRENIDVVLDSRSTTASFDIENRKLRLPYWKFSEDVYKMAMIHECGHALYTPIDYVDAIKARKDFEQEVYGHCLNIVEDCRIDRMMNERYPGAVRFYAPAFDEFVEKDWFGINQIRLDGEEDKLNFADKINMTFKSKFAKNPIRFEFSDSEESFVEELKVLKTFEEVKDCADRLFEMIKNEVAERLKMTKEYIKTLEGLKDLLANIKVISAENLKKKFKGSVKVPEKLDQMTIDLDQGRANYKKFVHNMADNGQSVTRSKVDRKILNTFISIFERKKAAKELLGTLENKTGILDTKKLSQYQMIDDIFLSKEIHRTGKNHGMVMLIDFSGSMSNVLKNVLKQVLILCAFCKKLSIPFEVYGFTSSGYHAYGTGFIKNLNSNFSLKKICDHTMRMGKIENQLDVAKTAIGLGGTPLDQSIIASYFVVEDFKKKYSVEICNFILLSDGGGDHHFNDSCVFSKKDGIRMNMARSFIGKNDVTSVIFRLMKDKLKVRTHTYYLVGENDELLETFKSLVQKNKGKVIAKTKELLCTTNAGDAENNYYLTNRAVNDMIFVRKLAEKIS